MESPSNGLAQLDARRVALGMTIEVLARRSGVSASTVERILSGRYGAASYHAVERIAAALGAAVRLEPVAEVTAMRLAQAAFKADQMLADEPASESSAPDAALEFSRAAERERLMHRLLGGSNRKLWAD